MHKGPNYGIDFKGGTILQIQFQKDIDVGTIRNSLSKVGLGNSEIKLFGNTREVSIKAEIQKGGKNTPNIIQDVLSKDFPNNPYEIRRVEEVGPKIGKELVRGAIWSVIFAFLLMGIYIGWRFEFKFAVGAVISLIHDITITVGVISLLNIEFDLTIVAAILTLVGYSLNDTIVIYDRIRENMKLSRKENFQSIINKSVNETLSRTIVTGLTTIFTLIVIFVFGGEVIHNFAFTLLFGIITGTFSSVYIASPVVLIWKEKTEQMTRKK